MGTVTILGEKLVTLFSMFKLFLVGNTSSIFTVLSGVVVGGVLFDFIKMHLDCENSRISEIANFFLLCWSLFSALVSNA